MITMRQSIAEWHSGCCPVYAASTAAKVLPDCCDADLVYGGYWQQSQGEAVPIVESRERMSDAMPERFRQLRQEMAYYHACAACRLSPEDKVEVVYFLKEVGL